MLYKRPATCDNDLHETRNRMSLLLVYTKLSRRSEPTSLRVEDMTLCENGKSLILLRQPNTDQTWEDVMLALNIEAAEAVTQ